MEFYVALLIDNPPDDPLNNLFCGNVGEINNDVFMENDTEGNKYCYKVEFIDGNNKEEIFSECVVNKEYLLPLFSFSPATYEKIDIIPRENDTLLPEKKNINSIRELWEKNEVHTILTLQLKPHKKSKNRFEMGQLVTIQFDFNQETSNNQTFTIQAGQIGIISKTYALDPTLHTDCVEVTFCVNVFRKIHTKKQRI